VTLPAFGHWRNVCLFHNIKKKEEKRKKKRKKEKKKRGEYN